MTAHRPRIVFAGTPDFAATCLKALLDADCNIVAAYCQPDRGAGRGKKVQYGPVKSLALEHQIPVMQPLNFKAEADRQQLAALQPELMIVVAYGLLLPAEVLAIPERGCVNIHASLLPRWRGAAPIQRAIEAGDTETGITIMQMDEGLDTGPMLLRKSLPIPPTMTGGQLHDALAKLGGEAIVEYLQKLPSQIEPEAQDDGQATYAHKLAKQEGEIDWRQPAQQIERKIRAFNPWPVCYTYSQGRRFRIWACHLQSERYSEQTPGSIVRADKSGLYVVCGDGMQLCITEIQPDNSKRMDVAAALNARADWFASGICLG